MIQRHHQIGTYQIEIDQSKNLLPMTKTIEFRDYVLIHLVATQSYYGLTFIIRLIVKTKNYFPTVKIRLRKYKCKYIGCIYKNEYYLINGLIGLSNFQHIFLYLSLPCRR